MACGFDSAADQRTDKEIARLMYELYGLSDDKIRIVEEVT